MDSNIKLSVNKNQNLYFWEVRNRVNWWIIWYDLFSIILCQFYPISASLKMLN